MAQRTRPPHRTGRPGMRRRPGTGGPGPRRRRRTRFDAPPPRPFALSGWALLPLRAFLGFTFCFAGLQKLANPNFFNANSPSSIQAQLIASDRISPLHLLLGHLLRFAVPIGVVIALAELAVGLGALLGLWTRVAAAGGMVLSLTLFLTVSFHSSPYYTGADIVFLFAWIPLLLAGSGGVLSLDAVIAARVAAENKSGPPTVVPIRFELVQQVCGNYEADTCAARGGQPCDVRRCPFLVDERGSVVRARARRGGPADPGPRRDRRRRVRGDRGRGRRGGRRARPGRRRVAEPRRGRHVRPLPHRAERGAGTTPTGRAPARATTTTAPAGATHDHRAGRRGHAHRPGQPGARRRRGHLHGPGDGRPRARAPAHQGPVRGLRRGLPACRLHGRVLARRQAHRVPVPRLGVRPRHGRRRQPAGAAGPDADPRGGQCRRLAARRRLTAAARCGRRPPVPDRTRHASSHGHRLAH